MKTRLVLTVSFVAVMGLLMVGLAHANYVENFEAATTGQFLTAPPLSWESMEYSTESSRVGENQHGWTSKFATQRLGTGSYMKKWLSFGTSGIITFSFDAYMDTASYPAMAPSGSLVGFNRGGWGPRAFWSSWTNGWRFKPFGATAVWEEYTIPHNTTVSFEISYDLTNQTTWGKAKYGSTTINSLVYQLSDNGTVFDAQNVVIVTAKMDGELGADIDNININVPEPSGFLALGSVLIGLAGSLIRRRR